MAKKSAVEKNKRRRKLVKQFEAKRAALKAVVHDRNASLEDRFKASMKLSELPRNASKTRVRNRCNLTGRPRGYYRKLQMSRIALRELTSQGLLPGMVKSSW